MRLRLTLPLRQAAAFPVQASNPASRFADEPGVVNLAAVAQGGEVNQSAVDADHGPRRLGIRVDVGVKTALSPGVLAVAVMDGVVRLHLAPDPGLTLRARPAIGRQFVCQQRRGPAGPVPQRGLAQILSGFRCDVAETAKLFASEAPDADGTTRLRASPPCWRAANSRKSLRDFADLAVDSIRYMARHQTRSGRWCPQAPCPSGR